jgi:hypothetical protein
MSLEEEKRETERRRQIRRSNERLRMLENMERERQDRMDVEIKKINSIEQKGTASKNNSLPSTYVHSARKNVKMGQNSIV